jgi:hypothetical protein
MITNFRLASKIGIAVLAILLSVLWFSSHKSLGFSVSKITSSLPFNPHWATDPLSLSVKDEILGQKYRYLSSGAQLYAFVSEDGKYVIKFFRMKHLIPSFVDYFRPEKKKRREENLRFVFQAYKMAYDDLKKEAGLVYVHFNKTSDLNTTLTVIDKLGRYHLIDLDKTEFIVQERAELIFSHLSKLDEGKRKEAIAAVLSLVQCRIDKGYADHDKAVSHNYGFVGDRPIHLDIGRLYKGERKGEYKRIEERIGKWVKENS